MENLFSSAINQTWKLHSLAGFITLSLVTFLLTNYSQAPEISDYIPSTTTVDFDSTTASPPTTSAAAPEPEIQLASFIASSPHHSTIGPSTAPVSSPVAGKRERKCKMYEGKWVYKPEDNPKYQVNQCPFLEEKMRCRKNGRPDGQYESWEWESNDCNIPLFDGKKMMEKLRGKRVIMVGDSLNRNMWESLACLLYTSTSDPNPALVKDDATYKLFKSNDHNFTLEFYWAPFLVHLHQSRTIGNTVVTLDRMEASSRRWLGADVMLFNTGHWWTHNNNENGNTKLWDFFKCKGKLIDNMEIGVAYERALSLWADWIRKNVDTTKTKVFFRSFSPEHKDRCFNASHPIMEESYSQLLPRSLINIVEKKIREMDGQVRYLNITELSAYRIDAHPSIYRYINWKSKDREELMKVADCSHWCLPGLPDTWNRIFYASLFFDNIFSSGGLTDFS